MVSGMILSLQIAIKKLSLARTIAGRRDQFPRVEHDSAGWMFGFRHRATLECSHSAFNRIA
jgi:hypothetical protein